MDRDLCWLRLTKTGIFDERCFRRPSVVPVERLLLPFSSLADKRNGSEVDFGIRESLGSGEALGESNG